MPNGALRTEKVGLPTRLGQRMPFDSIQTTRRRREHW
jgi:hypothetical protein